MTLRRVALALVPLAVATAPLLALWSNNASQVDPAIVVVPLALALGLGALALGVSWLLLRDMGRAAFLASLALVLFYVYGYALEAVVDAGLVARGGADWLVGGIFWALILAVDFFCVRTRLDLSVGATVVGGMAIAMIAFSAVQIAWYRVGAEAPGRWSAEDDGLARLAPSAVGPAAEPQRADSAEHPDIYYIVLDGYARHDILRAYYSYDNTGFIDELERRGFYVAKRSNSNYTRTHQSMASSLNGIYLDALVEMLGPESRTHAPTHWLVKNNWVGRYLRSKGYRYAQIYTNWAGTETSDIADLDYSFVPRWLGSEFAYVLLGTTALHRFAPDLAEFHLYGFEAMVDVADVEGPTFLLAHVLLPHNPYIFDRYGNVRMDVPLHLRTNATVKRLLGLGGAPGQEYVDQLVFLNSKILEVVDSILARSSVPPVIIVQGDHGWNQTNFWSRSAKESSDLRKVMRLSILNAYYVPDAVRAKLYPEITPVNSFRLLFSTLFGSDLPPLPDESFYSPRAQPYRLENATGVVRRWPW